MIVHPGEFETDADAIEILLEEDLPGPLATIARNSWCGELAISFSRDVARQYVLDRFKGVQHESTRLLAEYVLSLVAHSIVVVDQDVWIRLVCPQHTDCLMGGSLYVGPPLSEADLKTVCTTYGFAKESEIAEFSRTTTGLTEYFRGVGMFCPIIVEGVQLFQRTIESIGQARHRHAFPLFNTLAGEMVVYQPDLGVARISIASGESTLCAENLNQFVGLFIEASSQGRCLDRNDWPG